MPDNQLKNPRLKRLGASEHITEKVLSWTSMEDAAIYFHYQGVTCFEVLHVLEIESCQKLIAKLDITKRDFVTLLKPHILELEEKRANERFRTP